MADFGKQIRNRWLLDENVRFLNHGSFGACPRDVLFAQSDWRNLMEKQPVYFFQVEAPKGLALAKAKLAEFINAKDANVVFVENATMGINAVVRSLMPSWQRGDELLTTTHVYGAMRQTLQYASDVMGTKVVEAKVPFPISSEDEVVEAVKKAITPKTKFAIIDHVTSPTGLVYPIEKIIAILKERGIQVMIDGAHAPGMLDLKIENYGADYYTGNCHKWMFAPKGTAFLWVAPEHQTKIHAPNTSHNYKAGLHPEFDWIGTRDVTPYLSLIAAISFMDDFGREKIRSHNNALVKQARAYINSALGVSAVAPESMLGSLATIATPGSLKDTDPKAISLHDTLRDTYHCELPVIFFGDKVYIRISAQIYNEMPEYEHLTSSLKTIFS